MSAAQPASADWSKVCYGLDAGGSTVHLVRAARSGSRITYKTISAEQVEVAGSVEAKASVAAALSCGQSFVNWVEAPFASVSKATKVFPTLLDIKLPFPLEDCLAEFLAIGRSESGGVHALAVVARRQDVSLRLENLSQMGVDPHVLDHEGLALWTQSLREVPAAPGAVRVVLSVSDQRQTIVIGRGRDVISTHTVSGVNAASVERTLMARMSSVLADQSCGNPQGITWAICGTGWTDSAAEEAMILRLTERWSGTVLAHENRGTFLARALATRALLPGAYRCNLRKGDLAHSEARTISTKRSFRRAALFLVCGALLCAAALAVDILVGTREQREQDRFQSTLTDVVGYRLPGARGATAVIVAQRALAQQKQDLALLAESFSPSLLDVVNPLLIAAEKSDETIEYLVVTRERVELSGRGDGAERGQHLEAVLTEAGYPVRLEKGASNDAEPVTFTIVSVEDGS